MNLSALLMALGVAGVEIAADPTDSARVRHRPAVLPQALALGVRVHKPALLRLLAATFQAAEEGTYTFHERMGVAELLDMPAHAGSPAWCIAVAEALGVVREPAPPSTSTVLHPDGLAPAELAAALSSALGVKVWPRVLRKGARFPGEPDWNARVLGPNPRVREVHHDRTPSCRSTPAPP